MKKFILKTLLFVSITTAIFADFNLRLSYGTMFNDKINDYALQDGSYDLAVEFLVDPVDNISIGFGAQYVWPAEFESVPDGLGSNPINTSLPIYGVMLFNIMPDSTIEPYLVGRLGYSFVTPNPYSAINNVTGDLYYSIGLGGIFNNFYIEGSYDVNHGSYKVGYSNQDYNFSRFTIRFGYSFEFTNTSKESLYNDQIEVIKETPVIPYDNLEVYDEEGNIKRKQGDYKELKDFKIID